MQAKAQLVVVGASAAGLAATLAAARAGTEVLLLESKRSIGVPAAPAALAFDFLWPAALERPASCTERRHEGVRLQSASGRGVLVDAPLTIFDRGALDQHLARLAQDAGARIATGVGTLTLESLRAQGDVILFADGAKSLAHEVVASLRDPTAMTWGAALAFEREGAQRESRVTLTLGEHARGGRSQLNPLGGESWTHWTFYKGDAAEAETRARAALALDARLRGWDDAIARQAKWLGAAPDPVYTIPGTLVADRILVAGGAAGQGGLEAGLSAGWLAGQTAARALAAGRTDASALRAYERVWKREWQRGYHVLRVAMRTLAHLDDAGVDRLLWGARGFAPLVPGVRRA